NHRGATAGDRQLLGRAGHGRLAGAADLDPEGLFLKPRDRCGARPRGVEGLQRRGRDPGGRADAGRGAAFQVDLELASRHLRDEQWQQVVVRGDLDLRLVADREIKFESITDLDLLEVGRIAFLCPGNAAALDRWPAEMDYEAAADPGEQGQGC